MIKVMNLVTRKAGISRADFYDYWKNVHGPMIGKAIPNLRKYIQNHFIDVPGYTYEGDGIIETWYDSVESYLESMKFNKDPKAKPLGEDWAKIADMKPPKIWIVQEHVIKDETGKKK